MVVRIFILLSLTQYSWSQANWNNSTFVHQSGTKILDGGNDELILNGVNLGGWLMWEGWIWGGNFTQEKTIYNDIESIVGTIEADNFRKDVYDKFITRDDIEKISQECFNVVRIPFNHTILEDDLTPYTYKQSGWDRLDSILSWCEAFNVYAVLDLHSAPGGQSNSFTADPDFLITLWNGAINQQRTARLWKAIADRYKNRGIIAGYDLLNEPSTSNDSDMLDMYQRIIDSIRVVDSNHMLFIEGNNFATDFSMFGAPLDNNMAYEFHFYTWFFSSTIPDNLTVFTDLSNTSNIPIWCGEWGENDDAELDLTKNLFDDPQYGVSGSAIWTWKKVKKPSAQGEYNSVDTTATWNKAIKWIGFNANPTPSYVEMTSGMSEFLTNSDLANCDFNLNLNAIVENCTGVGVNDLAAKTGFRIYPNPVGSILKLDAAISVERMCIYDGLGRRVVYMQNVNTDFIDVSQLPPNFYLLEIQTKNELYRTQFIKN